MASQNSKTSWNKMILFANLQETKKINAKIELQITKSIRQIENEI